MKSRIFTPHNLNSETATAALKLRNDPTALGLGALAAAIIGVATIDLTVALHSNGVVESFASTDSPFLANISNNLCAGDAIDDFEIRVLYGSGDSRSKIIGTAGSEYEVTSTHDDANLALNSIGNLVSKPQPPTYTILSLVNDVCDKLDEILLDETDSFGYTKWSVFVNQADQTVVVVLHKGLIPDYGPGGPVATLFDVAGAAIASIAVEAPFICLDRFVGVVPSVGGGNEGARPSWE